MTENQFTAGSSYAIFDLPQEPSLVSSLLLNCWAGDDLNDNYCQLTQSIARIRCTPKSLES